MTAFPRVRWRRLLALRWEKCPQYCRLREPSFCFEPRPSCPLRPLRSLRETIPLTRCGKSTTCADFWFLTRSTRASCPTPFFYPTQPDIMRFYPTFSGGSEGARSIAPRPDPHWRRFAEFASLPVCFNCQRTHLCGGPQNPNPIGSILLFRVLLRPRASICILNLRFVKSWSEVWSEVCDNNYERAASSEFLICLLN